MKPATPSQLKVLSFIRGRLMTRGRPPTRKDIANAFGWASLNAAQETIEALRKKGLLRPPKEPRIACDLELTPEADLMFSQKSGDRVTMVVGAMFERGK